MPDVTADGFLHIIFDAFFLLRAMSYSELEVIAKDCLKIGQPRQFQANTGLQVYFIKSKQTFYS